MSKTIEELQKEAGKVLSEGQDAFAGVNLKFKELINKEIEDYNEDLHDYDVFNRHLHDEINRLAALVKDSAVMNEEIHTKVRTAKQEKKSFGELKDEIIGIKDQAIDKKGEIRGAVAETELLIKDIDEMITRLDDEKKQEGLINSAEIKVFKHLKSIKSLIENLKKILKTENK
jgi:hypothetical protein